MPFINIDLPAPHAKVEHVQTCIRNSVPLASFIKVPKPNSGGDPAYNELVCTEQDQENISFIILTMAGNGKLSLLFKKSELNAIGAKISHVHPLKFLGTVFSNPKLKECMRDIYRDYFKWNGFMDGLGPSLTTQVHQNKINQYLDAFAKECAVPAQDLVGYIESKDWEGMVRYLMIH